MLIKEGFSKLPPSEIKSRFGLDINEKQLQEIRTKLTTVESTLTKVGFTVPRIATQFATLGMHAVMFPIFFSAFTRRQNSATLAAGVAEW